MDNVPNIITEDNKSSRDKTANQNIIQNKLVPSDDFIVRKTSYGTALQLKNKHKHDMHYMNYVGEFDATAAYYRNDVVRVNPNVDYPDNDDTYVSASVGTWVCVHSVPDQNYSDLIIEAGVSGTYPEYVRYDNGQYYPRWPEPTTTASLDNPNGKFWELIGMLPMAMAMCVDGVIQTAYVGAMASGSNA